MKARLDSVILFTRNTEALLHFYSTILGLPVVEKIEGQWYLLDGGMAKIGIHQIGDGYPAADDESDGSRWPGKLVFDLDSDLRHTRERLIALGFSMRSIWSYENSSYEFCDGADPDGNIFQLKHLKR